MPWHRRLDVRVFAGVTVVVAVSLAAALLATGRTVMAASTTRATEDLTAARGAFDLLVRQHAASAATETRLITELPTFRALIDNAPAAGDQATVAQFADAYRHDLGADFCLVTDASGAWLGAPGWPAGTPPTEIADQLVVGQAGREAERLRPLAGRLYLTVTVPARFAEETLGTITTGYALDDTMAAGLASIAHTDVAFLCGDHLCGASLAGAARSSLDATMSAGGSALEAGSMAHRIDLADAPYFGGRFPLTAVSADDGDATPATQASLVLLQPWTPVERSLRQLYWRLVWIGAGAFGATLAAALVFARRLTRPLRDLAGAARQLGDGTWTGEVPVRGVAEARALADAFNHMTASLQAQSAERARAEESLRQRDAELLQAQKMDAVGRLAGGVAHEYNNLLTVILGLTDVLLTDGDPDEEARRVLDEIMHAGQSAAALTRHLLTFGRKRHVQPVRLDLNAAVQHTQRLLERLIGADIELRLDLALNVPSIVADPAQIETVLINLAANARDAMADGGVLTVATRPVEGEPFRRAELSVRDTGCGMSDDVRARLFEPFFTTKDVGKGTGLGLATVYGIVTQTNGEIDVESAVGRGTTFRLRFQAAT